MLLVIVYLAIGIVIFIFGIILLTSGLKTVSKQKISKFISKFSNNIFMSIFTGFIITLTLQSSSMVTIIAVTLADAKLLTLNTSAGIIMGANIGTTIAVQIYAFNFFAIAPYAVFLGSLFYFQKQNLKLKFLGNVILGFGIIFYGLKIMSLATAPFRDIQNSYLLTDKISNPIIGILSGIISALILQSSNIGIAILQVLASSGLVTLKYSLPVIYGLNIGTCSEAFLISFATNKEGKKVAIFNILFNFIGTIIFLPFTSYFEQFLNIISPHNSARQIANAHTFFNLFTAIIIIPFLKYIFYLINIIIDKRNT